LADLQLTVYPRKWSLGSCGSSKGHGKFASQRPTFHHCAAQQTLQRGNKPRWPTASCQISPGWGNNHSTAGTLQVFNFTGLRQRKI